MSDFDYESLLKRARENIPEDISSRARWRLPEPQIMIEGSNTYLNSNALFFQRYFTSLDSSNNMVSASAGGMFSLNCFNLIE